MRALVRAIATFDRGLALVETALVVAGLGAMVVLAFAQVVLRNAGLGGVQEFPTITQHLVLWVGMLGASLATADRKHISIEVVSNFFGPRTRRVVEALVDATTVLVCALLAFVAWKYIDFIEREEAKAIFTLGGVRFLRWWSLLVVPAGFGLMGLRFLRLAIERAVVGAPPSHAEEAAHEIEEFERRHSSDEKVLGPDPGGGPPP